MDLCFSVSHPQQVSQAWVCAVPQSQNLPGVGLGWGARGMAVPNHRPQREQGQAVQRRSA